MTKILKTVAILLAIMVASAAFFLWWTDPKRQVLGSFVRVAGSDVFKFTDIPRGQPLSPEAVNGYAQKLLAEMSVEQKVLQMSGDTSPWDVFKLIFVDWGKYNDTAVTAGADTRLSIPPFAFSDGPRGVVMNHSTAFPVAIARAASWDRDLQKRVGDAIAKEMRAQGANLWGGLCVNLLRHPLWGRAQETLGEDPFLAGELSVAIMEAVQAQKVMGCAKHFALNSIEETRTSVDVRVDERTLREVYLPHFKRLADANVAAFMSAYNKVNGEYCGENERLLRKILKEEWGYGGFVLSDFALGVHDAVKGARAGLDLEMPMAIVYGKTLLSAVGRGEVPMSIIDEAVVRMLRRKIEYAVQRDPIIAYPPTLVRAPEHLALSREAAEKGTVLLKNEGQLLPLDERSLKSLAVFGLLAEAPNLGDYGSSRVYPPRTVSVVEGLRDALGTARVRYRSHQPHREAPHNASEIDLARAAAKSSDAALIVVGFDHTDEGEYLPHMPSKEQRGGDRVQLALKPADRDLILAVAAENPNTIVVLVGASAITVEEWHEKVPAILMAFYPGEQGGSALARLLLGAVNPSGKLPFTVPKDATQLPPFDNRSKTVEYGYYHGYTLAEKRGWEPRYPFGYGLSYSRYEYANLTIDRTEVSRDATVTVSVDVSNVGTRSGEETVELYAGAIGSKVERPVKVLRGFEKVFLAPKEKKRVSMPLSVRDLAYYDVEAKAWRVELLKYAVSVGGSSRSADLLESSFRVTD